MKTITVLVELEFGDWVYRTRTDKGLTQVELGVLADLSPAAISSIEREKTSPLLSTVVKLAGALGFSLEIAFNQTGVNDGLRDT